MCSVKCIWIDWNFKDFLGCVCLCVIQVQFFCQIHFCKQQQKVPSVDEKGPKIAHSERWSRRSYDRSIQFFVFVLEIFPNRPTPFIQQLNQYTEYNGRKLWLFDARSIIYTLKLLQLNRLWVKSNRCVCEWFYVFFLLSIKGIFMLGVQYLIRHLCQKWQFEDVFDPYWWK